MRVFHINTSDSGGAADAAWALVSGIRRRGHEAALFVGRKLNSREHVEALPPDPFPALFRFERPLLNALGLQDWRFRRKTRAMTRLTSWRDASIVNLHNIHGGYFDYRELRLIAESKPLVWSLHDMAAMTGHCAYAMECERWKTGCHHCPRFLDRNWAEPRPIGRDATRLHWRTKRSLYRRAGVHIVTACPWMADRVKESILAPAALSITVIPDAIDTQVFKPVAKRAARAELGLPEENDILLAFPSPGRKGQDLLVEMLNRLPPPPNTILVAVGDHSLSPASAPAWTIRNIPTVRDDVRLNLFYSAASVFVLPTRADNVPLSLCGAMAAGTPCVAFDVGGVSRAVVNGTTGILIPPFDTGAMAREIDGLLKDVARRTRMESEAARHAAAEFSMDVTTDRYLALYDRILTSM